MPRVSFWMIRLSLVHLVLGLTAGAWLLLHKAGWLPGAGDLLALHVELVLIGFMVLLAVSVAWWILPRTVGLRSRQRGAWLAGASIAAGVWMVAIGTLGAMEALQATGRAAELVGAASWAWLLWRRTRPPVGERSSAPSRG